ncbi:hypothetical protein GF362_01415 [Candidatus Dojkabacteria bacterium]|nr:hypothetical protein [Candidatus Dojkabacteria bacterium]
MGKLQKSKTKLLIVLGLLLILISLFVIIQYLNYDLSPDNSFADELGEEITITEISKHLVLAEIGEYQSQYSPWVMHKSGWKSYLMFYCKNTNIGGVSRDRVWRAESFDGGISGWTNEQVILEGELGEKDDLSCSPGVVIDQEGLMHIYYVTGDRDEDMVLYLYHATAPQPGVKWTKKGPVQGIPQPLPGYIETPSPYLIDGQIVVYISAGSEGIYKISSVDGHNFTGLETVRAPRAQAGRVQLYKDKFFYVYSKNEERYKPPNKIFLSISNIDTSFPDGKLIMESNGKEWDALQMWSPHMIRVDALWRIYYAGNKSSEGWWGANTSIGLREFMIDFPTRSPTSRPDGLTATENSISPSMPNYSDNQGDEQIINYIKCGTLDYNQDNKINLLDFENFKTTYLKFNHSDTNSMYYRCRDSLESDSCGFIDNDNNEIVDIIDFKNFIDKYHQEKCS